MTLSHNHPTDRQRFSLLLRDFPFMEQVFKLDPNVSELRFHPDVYKKKFPTWSRKEQVMAKFFVAVFNGTGQGFNIADAGLVLDGKSREAIADWLLDPFWP